MFGRLGGFGGVYGLNTGGFRGVYLGGLMGFGFARYLVTSFAAKYLLAGIVVAAGLIFSTAARSIDLPF